MKGGRLAGAERQKIVQKLARLTGLSPASSSRRTTCAWLCRVHQGAAARRAPDVGRLDSRFTGIDRDAAGDRDIDSDPSYAAIYGPYTAMLNDYVRTELKYENDLPYEILTDRVRPWSYGPTQNQYVNVAETLRGAMSQNPALKVFVARRLLRLRDAVLRRRSTRSTTSGSTRRSHKNIRLEHYDAGHMMYIHKPSLEKLARDVAAFYEMAAPEK